MTKKKYIEQQFQTTVGYFPNIDHPQTFNEKIQWLKLYYHNPLLTKCADKYLVREYIIEKIGEEYLVPLLGVYDNENQINFDKLPNKFVLKLNNSSRHNIICQDKDNLDIIDTKTKLKKWLKPSSNLYYYSYEWAYRDIKPKIVCEKFLETKEDLKDYQFLCFHGKVEMLQVASERKTGVKVDFYDLNWKRLLLRKLSPNSENGVKKPYLFNQMIEIAEKLSQDFPLVRVDLYEVNKQIFTGELTFYPNAGMGKFNPISWDYKLGKLIDLNILKNIKRPTKVVFFSHSSQLAGAERSMIELILELREKNIFSHVVIPEEGIMQEVLEKNNIPYDIVKLGWWASSKRRKHNRIFLNDINSIKNFVNYLPRILLINPDLIYTNTIVAPWGAIFAKYLNKPHFWHIREYGKLDHKLEFDLEYKEIIKFVENNSDQIITNSTSISKYVTQFLTRLKPKIIYSYINIEQNLLKEKIDNPYTDKHSLKVIICGSIHPGKNQIEGIKTIKNLTNNNINVELLILGSITNKKYFVKITNFIKQHKLKNKVHLINFVNNPYPYIQVSDIVLISSIKEAFGRTATEGMLLKKVVVVNSDSGNKEVVDDDKTGYIYKSGDIKQLSDILKRLTDQKLREQISVNGFNSLAKFNSKEKYGYQIAKYIQDLSEKPENENPLFEIIYKINKNLSDKIIFYKDEKIGEEITEELETIKDSKFFKLWPLYCKIKKIFIK